MSIQHRSSLLSLLLVVGLIPPSAYATDIEPVLNDLAQIHYGSSISPDGTTMYFTHAGKDFSERVIMQARLVDGAISAMQPVQFGGAAMRGGDVQISPDGSVLTFYSRVVIGRGPDRKDGDLFYATKTQGGWSAPKRFPDTVNSEQNEFYPVLTSSGNLYFSRENSQTSYDLYVAEFIGDSYLQARKLNESINTELLESDAYVSPDESFMVFVRMHEQGAHGVSDLYITYRDQGEWTTPVNLGEAINFEGVDGSPFVTQDRRWLYFTSNRDAPEPKTFDTHLGVFRTAFVDLLAHNAPTQAVYRDVTQTQPYFQQGKVIFNTSMPNDGSVHFFTDNRGFEWGPTTIYQRNSDGEAFPIRLEGMKIPADVHISPDGQSLYYVDYGDNPSRVYRSRKADGQWQRAERFEALPEGSGYLTSTTKGEIYFYKDGDIHVLRGQTITPLPSTVNSDEGEHDPFIAQDGSFLLVVRQDAKGDSNMYLSIRTDDGWSQAKKLPAPFNDEKIDGSPYVTPDKQYLFFSSNRDGEILRTWQAPFKHYLTQHMAELNAGNR